MTNQTATIGGITMRWTEQGEGFPVVFIHGIPTSPVLWRHVMPKVSGVRCMAFEMVGYGDSMKAGEGHDISVARQADYLVAWLKHLGIERAVFVGHDLGGGVAQIAAVRQPGLCAGLLLTNSIGYDSWPIPSVKALNAAAALVKHLPDTAGRQILRTMMYRGHDDNALASESLDLHWQRYARHEGAASLIRQVEALDVNDTLAVADALPSLNIPARVVWGADDKFQKLEYGERFARDLKAPLLRIEGGLHFTPEDHPDVIAEQIHLLLEDVRRAESTIQAS
ncbi:soluble epoxide hydrolase [Pseudomonas sp. SCT]|uniref:alpha/beta fold hydrolase n=1 Tax=Pseudomonas sp. (strain SCT) TaxID=412955 RepID=UPI000ED43516|nr:alpha/beta fold hydrolase [Pseudomonas sp. SCT]GCA58171.1 soluble epoxide hydrolase [Pseudomonas sp. SCT]